MVVAVALLVAVSEVVEVPVPVGGSVVYHGVCEGAYSWRLRGLCCVWVPVALAVTMLVAVPVVLAAVLVVVAVAWSLLELGRGGVCGAAGGGGVLVGAVAAAQCLRHCVVHKQRQVQRC